MRKSSIFRSVLLIATMAFVSACTEQVPPGFKGKVLTTKGYTGSLHNPGRATAWGRDKLILLETGIFHTTEPMKVIMTDKLTLHFDLKISGRLDASDPEVMDSMFNDVVPVNDTITARMIYDKTTKLIVRNVGREIMSQYSVDDVHQNYARISKEIQIAITNATKITAFKPEIATLGNIKYPDVITAAVEEAKARDLAIAKEEASVKIELTKKDGERAVAEKQREIDLIKAESLRDQNKIIAAGLSDKLLRYRALEVQELMASKAGEGDLILAPYEAMTNNALQNRAYSRKN